MAQAGTLFSGCDFARDAGVVERRHVNQEAAGKSDVARDARAFLAQRLLGDLDDDFLALLQHVGNELRAARLLRAMMTLAVLRTAIAVVAASAIALPPGAGFCMRERKSLRTRACVGGCPAGRGFSAEAAMPSGDSANSECSPSCPSVCSECLPSECS